MIVMTAAIKLKGRETLAREGRVARWRILVSTRRFSSQRPRDSHQPRSWLNILELIVVYWYVVVGISDIDGVRTYLATCSC